jgi:3-methyladenine DNA glycosylase AlkD
VTTADEIVAGLRAQANSANAAGMARFGINPAQTLGVSMPALRSMAKTIGRDHNLAQALWETGLHEARILAALVDEPSQVTKAQMERWAKDFDSWDVCDQVCGSLFDRTPYADEKAKAWSASKREFVKRAGFVLMAAKAVHDKGAPDEVFLGWLPIIEREAGDERNFVRKAVNWALRQIGKRNRRLHAEALAVARRLEGQDSKAARWVGADAVKELNSEKTRARITR